MQAEQLDLRDLFERLETNGAEDLAEVDRLESLLADRIAILLSAAEVTDLERAAYQAAEFLAGPAGRRLESASPERYDRWTRLVDRLAAAAESADDAGIVRLLRSLGGKPQVVLDALTQRSPSEPISQSQLQESLAIEPTYLSKVIRRLAEADLIARWAEGRTRHLRLTALGRRWAKPVAALHATRERSTRP